jgi:hypothetical protein
MTFKKLAIASAAALMLAQMGSAFAIDFDSAAVLGNVQNTTATSLATALESILGKTTSTTDPDTGLTKVSTSQFVVATPDISVLSGAVNSAAVNGAIDISGTNVSITGISGSVEAKANSVASTTSTATSFAINGNNFSTTVIGAMNSATVDVAGRIANKTNETSIQLGVGQLASSGGTVGMTTTGITGALGGIGNNVTPGPVLAAGSSTDLQLDNLTSLTTSKVTDSLSDLQKSNIFNMALNVASIDAGVKIAAAVDPNAWFLNPQTGVVNLSNLQLATTAIGAMNSSVTKLGTSLAK